MSLSNYYLDYGSHRARLRRRRRRYLRAYAIITMGKLIYAFLFLSDMSIGLRFLTLPSAVRATTRTGYKISCNFIR